MPRQQLQANGPPFTKVLSALLKPDLVRLCTEFRLHGNGSVVVLRNRLKDYLNIHRNTLLVNPRYTALFPRHRRPNQPSPSPSRSSHTSSRSSSLSYVSSVHSFPSWNGIEDQQDLPQDHPHQLEHHPPQDPDVQYFDPPPSATNSSPPPAAHAIEGRKFLLLRSSLCLPFTLFMYYLSIIGHYEVPLY